MSTPGDRLGATPTPGAASTPPAGITEASLTQDKYEQMLSLADLFEGVGNEMRERSRLGSDVLSDDDVSASSELSPRTWSSFEEELRNATTGRHGLLGRSVELDADALVVRATVQTYRWIDELQQAAYKTLGSIAGRAIGYLAPEVALGGAIVAAGLIETDTLDRDGVTAYLNELAESNPELMEHVAGGGGLVEGLQMRSLLTSGVLASERGPLASRAGLRALGVGSFEEGALAALRDSAGAVVDDLVPAASAPDSASGQADAPSGVADLISRLVRESGRVAVQRVAPGRYLGYLPAPAAAGQGRVRLVGADTTGTVRSVVTEIERIVAQDDARAEPARFLLVGAGQGGAVATEIAASQPSEQFVVDQVVTVGAPAAAVQVVPASTRVLSLEDRSDPVALFGSLMNTSVSNRVTVVYDAEDSTGRDAWIVGGREADSSTHPGLVAEIDRIRSLGYLA